MRRRDGRRIMVAPVSLAAEICEEMFCARGVKGNSDVGGARLLRKKK